MEAFKFLFTALAAKIMISCGSITEGKASSEKTMTQFHDHYNQGEPERIWLM
jgi:hypothetical protein